jgi:hypothetical protein
MKTQKQQDLEFLSVAADAVKKGGHVVKLKFKTEDGGEVDYWLPAKKKTKPRSVGAK